MKYRNSDLMEMLEYLELFAFEERFKAICESPKFSSLDSVQFLQELVAAEYDYRKEDRLDRLLRLSRLGKNTALASNLKSGDGRIYNENVVDLIDRRYHKEGCSNIVFTSNKQPVSWRQNFTEEETLLCALDRIFDDSLIFNFNGDSHRGLKREVISLTTKKNKSYSCIGTA